MIRRQRVRPGWNAPKPAWYVAAEFLTLVAILGIPLLIGALCSVKG